MSYRKVTYLEQIWYMLKWWWRSRRRDPPDDDNP